MYDLPVNPHRQTCYHLFGVLARGWRAPKTAFVLNQLDEISYRVMPMYRSLKRDRVKHDDFKMRAKRLRRIKNPTPEQEAALAACEGEYQKRKNS